MERTRIRAQEMQMLLTYSRLAARLLHTGADTWQLAEAVDAQNHHCDVVGVSGQKS